MCLHLFFGSPEQNSGATPNETGRTVQACYPNSHYTTTDWHKILSSGHSPAWAGQALADQT